MQRGNNWFYEMQHKVQPKCIHSNLIAGVNSNSRGSVDGFCFISYEKDGTNANPSPPNYPLYNFYTRLDMKTCT